MEMRGVRLQADGLELTGELHLPSGDKLLPALCICHGIPAVPPDPSDRGYTLLAQRFCRAGFITLIFSFRGTGRSEGNLDILGWTRDLQAALDFLHNLKEVDKGSLSLLGFSGGAAVSIYAAAHDPRVSSVATCACPADFRSIFQRETPVGAVQRLREIGAIRDRDFPPSIEEWERGFETITPINWIDKISPRHLLLVHGDADELIPLEHAQRLYEKANEPKELRVIPGARHKMRLEEAAMAVVLDWLKVRC
ncbi:MAG: alpha/beta fold hydrolase [Dehalococcoidia bacterium]|nr:MAG: alpha/beta fold hydrolase [Dehalococcoidia bacterium]